MKTNSRHVARMAVMPLLLLLCMRMSAQNQPVYSVPSPEVASLGLYGQVPVSHYTGVPDISIPLYEVKVGSFSLPISTSYHISSVKPNVTPGPLGLGWNLIAGGYITRTVRGYCDEQKDQNGDVHGLYDHTSKLKEVKNDTSLFSQYTKEFCSWKNPDTSYELCADEFAFNFCGYSGNFYLNEEGGWTVVSDQDIKVEFSPTNNGFVTLTSLKKRLNNFHSWSTDGKNHRFFNKFTIITPDGSRYEFGGDNAIEFSIPYYNRNNSDLYASTWRLTKITTPQKHVVTIEYDASPQVCELQYVPRFYQVYSFSTEKSSGIFGIDDWLNGGNGAETYETHPIKTGRMGYTGNLLFPVIIKKITTPNETIEFSYSRDWDFGRLFIPNNGWQALYWEDTEQSHKNIYDLFSYNPATQFFALTNASSGDSPNETRKVIADSLRYYYLTNMVVKSKMGGIVKNCDFDYEKSERRKLSCITIGRSDNSPQKIIDIYNDKMEYHFTYETAHKMPKYFIIGKTDSWGYYHGDANKISDPLNIMLITPNTEATKAETLTGIQYPTGGRTLFEYEQNNYSQMMDSTHTQLVNKTGSAGGLRISKITTIDREDHITGIKKYYYSKLRTSPSASQSSGILKGLPFMRIIQYGKATGCEVCAVQMSSVGYTPPVTNMNTPDVGYSWVIEETLDGENNSLGYVRYHYSNYDADIEGNSHLDETALYAANTSLTSAIAPYTSVSFERGKLLSKEYYSKSGKLLKKDTYQYARTSHSPLLTAHQFYMSLGPVLEMRYGWLTHTHTASYLPKSITEYVYSQSGSAAQVNTHAYTYNTHKMVSKDTYSMSDGGSGVVSYKYPFDYPAYSWMTQANITSPVVEKKTTAGGLSRTETSTYASAGQGIPYIQKQSVTRNDISSWAKTLYEVSRTDSYGNPVEITEDGKTSVLIWGGYGQRLIARIENASYTQCKYRLGLNPLAFSGTQISSLNYSAITSARGYLPGSLFHIYKYNRNLLLESETLPNGLANYYQYDALGRLREVYYFDSSGRKTVTGYDYHYYNKP